MSQRKKMMKKSEDDEDMTLLTRKFKKFFIERSMKKKENEQEKEKKNATHYKCNKKGHYKLDCPLLKKYSKKTKKRAMSGIQRHSNLSSLEEEEEAINLCLMTIKDEVNSKNSFQFTFDELFEAFNNLMD